MKRLFTFPKTNFPEYIQSQRHTLELDHLSYNDVTSKRQEYLAPSLSTFQAFKEPFYPIIGYMQYLIDYDNKVYLDLLAQNLTISVGHQHPNVIKHVEKQLKLMPHCTTMYYNESTVKAAELLRETLPKENDWVIHFVNSGSEAVDLALLMARTYTHNWEILALRNAYHGLHSTAMAVTGLSVCKQDIPHSFGVKHVMNPDMYRGVFADQSEKIAVQNYARDVQDTIDYETSGKVAGFIYEYVQGYGGIHEMPKGYIEQTSEMVRNAGGVVIADEVQSGFGRMSDDYFWSYEMASDKYKHIPDIIVTAKGLGNGFPIAAVMAKREIAESMTHKQFFNTYGGNPLVCASAQGVLKELKTKEFQENVSKTSKVFKQGLAALDHKFPFIGQIRGKGLMYGIDIVEENTKIPDSTKASLLFEHARKQGIIMGLGGIHKNVLRVMPPMCVTPDDAFYFHQVMDHICEYQN